LRLSLEEVVGHQILRLNHNLPFTVYVTPTRLLTRLSKREQLLVLLFATFLGAANRSLDRFGLVQLLFAGFRLIVTWLGAEAAVRQL
jgi:hypothetical protein